jgi:hypothetical protein
VTVIELLQQAWDHADNARRNAGTQGGSAAREFALSCTAIEDAMMRYTRGVAMKTSRFVIADLDKMGQSVDQAGHGEPTCQECGNIVRLEWMFCARCGTAVAPEPEASTNA